MTFSVGLPVYSKAQNVIEGPVVIVCRWHHLPLALHGRLLQICWQHHHHQNALSVNDGTTELVLGNAVLVPHLERYFGTTSSLEDVISTRWINTASFLCGCERKNNDHGATGLARSLGCVRRGEGNGGRLAYCSLSVLLIELLTRFQSYKWLYCTLHCAALIRPWKFSSNNT